jgi:hypothetical protein
MQVRLAFSIAIRASSDILILDEVLAVGDEAFQRKCLDVFEEYKKNGKTVVLVTHDMDTVKRFCNKAILLNDGKIITQGDPMLVADEYSRLNMPVENIKKIKKPITNLKVKTYNRLNKETNSYKYGEKMIIELSWPRSEKVLNAGVSIYSNDGICVYATNTFIDHVDVLNNKIMYAVELNLIPAKYFISAVTFLGRPEMKVDFVPRGPEFTVIKEKISLGEGISVLKHEWRQIE